MAATQSFDAQGVLGKSATFSILAGSNVFINGGRIGQSLVEDFDISQMGLTTTT
jgi:hypothetical protein